MKILFGDNVTQVSQLGQDIYNEIEERQEVFNPVIPQRNKVKPQMKSAVLLVASFWHAKYHAKKVNKLLEKTFTQEDMFSDMVRLCNMLSQEKPQKHRKTDR